MLVPFIVRDWSNAAAPVRVPSATSRPSDAVVARRASVVPDAAPRAASLVRV
jgi:hypothetical protein